MKFGDNSRANCSVGSTNGFSESRASVARINEIVAVYTSVRSRAGAGTGALAEWQREREREREN